jgi:hypothetical protein
VERLGRPWDPAGYRIASRRRGGRAAVDQYDKGLVLGEVAGARVEALSLLRVAGAGRDNLALIEERIGNRDRLIEEAAGIIAA